MKSSMVMFTFFVFNQKYPFLRKSGPKRPNHQFKLKFGSQSNSDMKNSVILVTFFVFDWKYLFWGKFGPKNKNYQFKLKLGIQTNSNMENSMVTFTFSVCDWKYSFGANLVQNVKIVSLKSDSQLPNKNVLFASLKALYK